MKDYKLTERVVNGMTVYEVYFTDGDNICRCVEVDVEVYQILKESQSKDEAYLRAARRHGLCSFDEALGTGTTEDSICNEIAIREMFCMMLNPLTEKQKRRLLLHFVSQMNFEKIAKLEHTSARAIKYSVYSALDKLRANYFFEKFFS